MDRWNSKSKKKRWTFFHGPWFQDFTIYGPSVNLYILHNEMAIFYCFKKGCHLNIAKYCIFLCILHK